MWDHSIINVLYQLILVLSLLIIITGLLYPSHDLTVVSKIVETLIRICSPQVGGAEDRPSSKGRGRRPHPSVHDGARWAAMEWAIAMKSNRNFWSTLITRQGNQNAPSSQNSSAGHRATSTDCPAEEWELQSASKVHSDFLSYVTMQPRLQRKWPTCRRRQTDAGRLPQWRTSRGGWGASTTKQVQHSAYVFLIWLQWTLRWPFCIICTTEVFISCLSTTVN